MDNNLDVLINSIHIATNNIYEFIKENKLEQATAISLKADVTLRKMALAINDNNQDIIHRSFQSFNESIQSLINHINNEKNLLETSITNFNQIKNYWL